ncbi:MAG: DUF2147 domain-containing protein [Bacteroidota bacterium]
MKHILTGFIAVMLTGVCALLHAQKFKAGDIAGKWVTEENKSIVEVFEKDGKYYGRIIWLKEPNDDDGLPKKDTKNPSEKLRDRPIKGIVFMKGFEYKDGKWENGKVYDPESGNLYSGTLKLITIDEMDLRGYIGISLLGRTSKWTRYKKE